MLLLAVLAAFPLLAAEADPAAVNHGATIITVSLCALQGFFSLLSSREQRLSKKDQLNADAEKAQMRSDIAVLKVHVEICQQDRAEQKVEIAQLRAAMERHGIQCPAHPAAGLTPPAGPR